MINIQRGKHGTWVLDIEEKLLFEDLENLRKVTEAIQIYIDKFHYIPEEDENQEMEDQK